MVILMDPLEDPDDILRANRSREKTYVFDVAFDYSASQVGPGSEKIWSRSSSDVLHSSPSACRRRCTELQPGG